MRGSRASTTAWSPAAASGRSHASSTVPQPTSRAPYASDATASRPTHTRGQADHHDRPHAPLSRTCRPGGQGAHALSAAAPSIGRNRSSAHGRLSGLDAEIDRVRVLSESAT